MSITRRVSVLLGAAALATVGAFATVVPASAAPDVQEFATATQETEQQNLVHVQQVALAAAEAASTPGNISCRADKPVFAAQPEFDGRITVKGEDTAATTVECVDLFLIAQEVISAELYIEWRDTTGAWRLIEKTRTPISGRMSKGVGVAPGFVDYVYPANDPSQGHPHRACVRLDAPVAISAPFCQVFATAEKTTV